MARALIHPRSEDVERARQLLRAGQASQVGPILLRAEEIEGVLTLTAWDDRLRLSLSESHPWTDLAGQGPGCARRGELLDALRADLAALGASEADLIWEAGPRSALVARFQEPTRRLKLSLRLIACALAASRAAGPAAAAPPARAGSLSAALSGRRATSARP